MSCSALVSLRVHITAIIRDVKIEGGADFGIYEAGTDALFYVFKGQAGGNYGGQLGVVTVVDNLI